MRRFVWFSLGAAVGIVAYRRGQELAQDARRQGIVPTVQQAAIGIATAAATARGLIAGQSTDSQEGGRSWIQQRFEVAS